MSLIEKIKKEMFEVTDHLRCGNENCFYDGEWCYHFTDKDLDKLIDIIKSYECIRKQ